jgi:hypothetical protein
VNGYQPSPNPSIPFLEEGAEGVVEGLAGGLEAVEYVIF